MRTRMPLGIIPLLALSIAGTTNAQITKRPMPGRVSVMCAISPMAAALPTTREGFCI